MYTVYIYILYMPYIYIYDIIYYMTYIIYILCIHICVYKLAPRPPTFKTGSTSLRACMFLLNLQTLYTDIKLLCQYVMQICAVNL